MQDPWAIECRKVTVSFTGQSNELEDIDLTVAAGEYVSLVGPSGCGKSTLLRVIAGLLQPTSGEARVFGCSGPPAERKTGFVFQDPTLLPWRTALGNVALPLEIKGCDAVEARERAMQALADVGLASAAAQYPGELSGGMRQRVSLARAMVDRSRVLLLDEPFAAVDALRRERFSYEMWRFGRRRGLTVLLVTHSISEAVWMSHRVVVMAERPGQIVGQVAVDLPEQRTPDVPSCPAFVDACGRVRRLLEENGGMNDGAR